MTTPPATRLSGSPALSTPAPFSIFALSPQYLSVSILCWIVSSTLVFAGGGPENAFLVVNSASQESLVIANHYAEGRQIHSACVFQIDWPDAPQKTDIITFRKRLLGPILAEIKRRKLTRQIDYIVYSSGFPYAVDFSSDLGEVNAKYAIASITSLTYMHEWVMQENPLYRQPINTYARNLIPKSPVTTQGFRSRYGFDNLGRRTPEKRGQPTYYLSMMLGTTRGTQNNSVPEILNYLHRGVEADGTRPDGTIYYVRNNNVRSTTRHDMFAEAIEQLAQLGVSAEDVQGVADGKNSLPVGKPDVMGAMVGFYKFSWAATGSKMLPGAICENLTSWGGALDGSHTTQQSLLCEFLRHGAVASSGTVTEPFAIAAKFPHPKIHVHYARGCSVAEAYYQSLHQPGQLIIVGDPLCQPWAVPPTVTVSGLETNKVLSGTLDLQVSAQSGRGVGIRNFDVFIDGVLLTETKPGTPIKLNTKKLRNGYHELRVVAIEDSQIETQGRYVAPFVSMNTNEKTTKPLSGVSGELIPKGAKLRVGGLGFVEIKSRGAKELRLYKGRQLLGKYPGASGRIRFSAADLGAGPSMLTPVAVPKDPNDKVLFGFPIRVDVI